MTSSSEIQSMPLPSSQRHSSTWRLVREAVISPSEKLQNRMSRDEATNHGRDSGVVLAMAPESQRMMGPVRATEQLLYLILAQPITPVPQLRLQPIFEPDDSDIDPETPQSQHPEGENGKNDELRQISAPSTTPIGATTTILSTIIVMASQYRDPRFYPQFSPSAIVIYFSEEALSSMDRNITLLQIDLFRPTGYVEREDDVAILVQNGPRREAMILPRSSQESFHRRPEVFPPQDLEPLLLFRNLVKLEIVGMCTSYQHYIWKIMWNNRGLRDIVLGMAKEDRDQANGRIAYRERLIAGTTLGINPMVQRQTTPGVAEKLSIVEIKLDRFIVGTGFLDHFGPELKLVVFISCKDAGFELPEHLAAVTTIQVIDEDGTTRRYLPEASMNVEDR